MPTLISLAAGASVVAGAFVSAAAGASVAAWVGVLYAPQAARDRTIANVSSIAISFFILYSSSSIRFTAMCR